ncbi:hypothetical protein PGT21_007567 [Puccinia graminis f. sp. tritici]|uniref:Uncharacterized protein n=1 Tax=Puccinia graminis f. sp. tritici TaxID=56615 RepID=A0A5B0PX85_PUCGR|nr:hypothetical protein PGTUg99_028969 [Puccinia graminis f. sp. tritici]KAA1105444.1 hypothetical protein PGT21_007567 [Puccinia graminis f. sp. tritici]
MAELLFQEDDYLNNLPNHPIFNNNNNNNNNNNKNKNTFSIINQNQLILSAPPELRLISLTNYKTQQTQQYKLLIPRPRSALPIKPVTTLTANPSSRLLAICSTDQVSVLSLPRTEEHSDSSTQIECQTTKIGAEDDQDDRREPITKVLWHPWSHRASTLLILHSNGILLEFDVSRDTLNPTQTIDFNSPYSLLTESYHHHPSYSQAGIASTEPFECHPSLISSFQQVSLNSSSTKKSLIGLSKHPQRSSTPLGSLKASRSKPRLSRSIPPSAKNHRSTSQGTYGTADRASSTAVSLCFGTGAGDWGPLTLYAIMLNGDMYAICPYLPKNAVIPLSYRNSLLFFLTAKLQSISNTQGTGKSLMDLQGPLERSLDYLNSLSDVPDEPIDEGDLEADCENEEEDGVKRNRRKETFEALLTPLRQGPFLMTPSPIETNENEEETVSDLLHFRYSSSPTNQRNSTAEPTLSDPNNTGLGVFMIAYQSRIDVCLEVEKIEPRWVSVSDVDAKAATTTTTTTELPMLVTYECIDLRLMDSGHSECIGGTSPLRMSVDARYNDTIYVSHRCGIHGVSMQGWLESLLAGEADSGRLGDIIEERTGSLVGWLVQTASSGDSTSQGAPGIAGVSVIDDAYLGYSLMALTDDGQLVVLPLKHRPMGLSTGALTGGKPETAGPVLQLMPPPPVERRSISRGPSGLLGDGWTVPVPLASDARGPGLSRPPVDSSTVTSAMLRYGLQVSNRVDHYIRHLVEAINLGQSRLALQIQEFQCQIRKLNQYPSRLDALDQHLQAQLDRIENIHANQKKLLKKADLVLQKLVDDRNRILSREEVRWFAELDRMFGEVFGDPDGDKKGLKSLIDQLKSQLEATKARIRPAHEDQLSSRTNGRGKTPMTAPTNPEGIAGVGKKMGESQLVPIYHKLEQANGCLAIIHDQIAKINKTLAARPSA